jgi:hypothetical protein
MGQEAKSTGYGRVIERELHIFMPFIIKIQMRKEFVAALRKCKCWCLNSRITLEDGTGGWS